MVSMLLPSTISEQASNLSVFLNKVLQRRCLPFALALLFLSLLLLPRTGSAQSSRPGHKLTLESIEVQGNSKTNVNVILRQLTIQPGGKVSPDTLAILLLQNQRRLAQTNFFKNVEIYTRPGSEKGRVVAIIEVTERKGPYFQFEGGHSDLNGWYFVPASLRFDNLFGSGNRFGIRWFIGDRISKLSVWYSNKIIREKLFLDAELFGGTKMFIHYFGARMATQEVDFGGLQLKLRGTGGLARHLFVGYRSQTHDPQDFADLDDDSTIPAENLPASIRDDLEDDLTRALSAGLFVDLRDNPVYPTAGLWGAVTGEVADGDIGSDTDFAKVTFDARAYHRLFGQQVVALHLKGGYSSAGAPFYERFYLGGANSLRGYADRRLTPEGWGTKLMLLNSELRFPLSEGFPNQKVTGVLFFDAGGIWQTGQDPNLDDLKASLGFGVRAKLPVIGVTRFDLAFPLDKIDNDDFRFHLSLGQTF